MSTIAPTNDTNAHAHFDKLATEYAKMTGGVSVRIGEQCMPYLPALTSSTRILDSACGPGIMTKLILEQAASQGIDPPPHIVGIDLAQGMIDLFNLSAENLGWKTVESKLMSAEDLVGLEDESFDIVVMNFGIFMVPDADKCAREMYRVLKPGGVVVATTWKRSAPVDILENVVSRIKPEDLASVFPISKDWLKANKLENTLKAGGFDNVEIQLGRTFWMNENSDEFVAVITGPFFQRIWKDWGEEDQAKLLPLVKEEVADEMQKDDAMEMVAWLGIGRKQ